MPTIRIETLVHASPEECFDLSLSVDAHTSSMSRSGERIVGGVSSGVMALGDSVTWQARHFGVPFRMTSRVTAYERPARFVDEQVNGPFGRWWHEHTFAETGPGRTLMVDVVEFSSPLGVLGRAADALVLRRYMTRLLTERNTYLRRQLERDPRLDRFRGGVAHVLDDDRVVGVLAFFVEPNPAGHGEIVRGEETWSEGDARYQDWVADPGTSGQLLDDLLAGQLTTRFESGEVVSSYPVRWLDGDDLAEARRSMGLET